MGHEPLSIFLCQKILDVGGDISQPNHRGRTLLHASLPRKCESVAMFLVKSGANVSAPCLEGEIPLSLAVKLLEVHDLIRLLLEAGACPYAQHMETQSPLEWVIENARYEYVHLLLRTDPPWPDSHINARLWRVAASVAREASRIGLVSLLVALVRTGGLVLEMVDGHGRTALHYLCQLFCVQDSTRASDTTKVMQTLADGGVDLARKDGKGHTPLHWACHCGSAHYQQTPIGI
ncbi:ankyrin repeat-containing domain protein [Aspergillus karnatakaensis]|uniref:ankyrin repeat domain-containing protein n=1 Tax=Aspergillus karnatakaensis TaxID=1810916 RepID=UPI003CCDE1F1